MGTFRLGLLLALAASLLIPADPARAEAFRAGFGTADITPPVGWRRAGGFSEVVSTGVHDPLLTKSLVLSQGDVSIALVGNDLCSVPRELTDRARALASRRTGIPAANIVITATHTHGGPEYYGPLRDVLHERAERENGGRDPHEPIDYQALLVERWAEVIARAHADRRPARLSVVVPQQLGMAFNRRYLMADGSTGWNPGKLNPQVVRPLGPTDPDLPIVLVRDAATARPLGGLTVFAMHTAIYGAPPFGADYPGHLQAQLRSELGEPGFISLFAEGCAGDINHVDIGSGEPQGGETYPPQVGARLAATIARSLPLDRPIRDGQLAMRSATIRTPVAPIDEREYAEARRVLEALDRDERPFLVVVDAWRKAFRHKYWRIHGGRLPQEVQAIRLDRDTAIVTLPHEVFVELGMAIKSASPFRTTIVISLANDLDFYIPVRRAFEEGHYEPTTCPLEPGCGERLVEASVKLLNELKP
jgi:neutral ceramidase